MRIVRISCIIMGLLTALIVIPQPTVAQQRDKATIPAKQQCIEEEDGTFDCSNLFIERGVPITADNPQSVDAQCSPYTCNLQNPYEKGCTVDYGVVAVEYIYAYETNEQLGYVQLWWSNTCQTNWTRLVAYDWSRWGFIETCLFLDDNVNGYWEPNESRTCTPYPSIIYDGTRVSGMLYARGIPAYATGTLSVARHGWGGHAWTDWR